MPRNPNTPASAAQPPTPTPQPPPATPANGPLTSKERDALFDQAANGMTPERKNRAPADPIRQWEKQILRKHQQGFSPRQIALMARAPRINLKISARAVQRLIAEHEKAQKPAAAGQQETLKS